jgi:hypothetical protein
MESLAKNVVKNLLSSGESDIIRYLKSAYKVYNINQSLLKQPFQSKIPRGVGGGPGDEDVTAIRTDSNCGPAVPLGEMFVDDFTLVQLAYDEDTNEIDFEPGIIYGSCQETDDAKIAGVPGAANLIAGLKILDTRIQNLKVKNDNIVTASDPIMPGGGGGGGSTGKFVTTIASMTALFFATVLGTVRR